MSFTISFKCNECRHRWLQDMEEEVVGCPKCGEYNFDTQPRLITDEEPEERNITEEWDRELDIFGADD